MTRMIMHRHNGYVDHVAADHNHGVCSEHAHWAGGSHAAETSLEESTEALDPLGWDAATYKRLGVSNG